MNIDLPAKILTLGLPAGSFMIVGSSILQVLDIRPAHDIDIVVSQSVYDKLLASGEWQLHTWDRHHSIRSEVFDVGTDWLGEPLESLLPHAHVIGGIPYLGLADLRTWKQAVGRPKDLHDIALIDTYLATHP